ncbi:RAB11-binding protein RELCH like, partial [Schistosoma japonicum]
SLIRSQQSVHLEKPPHPNFNDDRIQSHKLNENVQKIDDNRKSIEVAEYLLDKKLFLSALEYYFEQLERGKSIKILHEFFTSPNFVDNLNLSSTESSNLLVGKYSSLSSLDSSDIGRISDDGNTLEEKLKVLEYELRKKNDEISTLRNELTSLVACGFKSDTLTSQTSEVEEHGLPSLESWHEVAINLRKPPSILSLLRSYWYPSTSQSSPNRVDLPTPNFCEVAIQTESEQNVYTVTVGFDEYSSIELQSKNEEISLLKSKINHLESQYSAASQNVKDLHNQLICLKREHVEMIDKTLLTKHTTITSNQTVKVNDSDDDCNQSNLSNTDNPSYSQKKYLPDRINKSRRKLSTEFSKYIAHLLPDDDMLLNEINRNFHLTDSLDEFVTFLAQYIEKILTYLVDKGKLIFLPLLVQIICLHPNSSVRDRFLCLLFDFLSSTSSTSLCQQSPASVENKIHFDFLHHSSTLLMKTMKSNSDSLVDVGPTRLEGELLPCLWLQINKCTISDLSKRLFLVSACGVIAPHLPSHLQSSIMLSIMESSLDEERDTTVLAASIRSLSCLTSSMSDSHKLSQIIRRLNSLLVQTVNIFSDEQQLKLFYLSSKHSSSSAAGGIASLSNPVYHSIMNYFLPSIAQWCLELDSIQQNLLDPWLIHLDNYILARQNTKDEVVPDTTLLYLNAFYYLTPFLHAWLLLSLIKKSTPDECIWTAMQNLLQIYRNSASEFEHLLMQNFIAKENESTVKVSPISSNLVDTPMILGQDSFELLSEMMKYLCQSEKKQSPSISSTQASSFVEQSFYSNHLCQMDEWLAKQWLDKYLLSKLIHLLEQLPYCNGGHCLQIKSFLDLDYANYSFDDVIKHQFDEYFVYPCTESLQSNNFKVAFSICRFLVSIGHALKSDGVIKLIAPHFKAKLMKQTEHGKIRIRSSENVIDKCYISTCTLTTDLNITIQEILLPAIRPCLSCTDSSVRRAAANLLHALIEILRFIGGSSHHHTHGNAATVAIFPTIQNDICKSNLFGLIWPFLSQVSRDDLTGQRKRITPDQADWSVLCCSLGPLYSFLLLICVPYLNSTLSSPSATYIPASTGDPPRNCKVDSVSLPTSTTIDTNIVPITDTLTIFSEYANYRTMAFDLLSLQYDLVVGRTSPNELNSNVHNSGIDYTMDRLIISQRRFWSTLVNNLLDLTNRLLPICGILPWLFDLAEMNNTLPSLELRVELANHLFTVFSTAAYCILLVLLLSTKNYSIFRFYSSFYLQTIVIL